jgi:hypothetical protein
MFESYSLCIYILKNLKAFFAIKYISLLLIFLLNLYSNYGTIRLVIFNYLFLFIFISNYSKFNLIINSFMLCWIITILIPHKNYNLPMQIASLFQIYIITCLYQLTYQQASPIWSTASVFYTGSGVAQLPPGSFTKGFTITTSFPISTSVIKKPFFGLTGVDQMELCAQ